jgi:spore germination protein KA
VNNDIFTKIYKTAKNILVYKRQPAKHRFVFEESTNEGRPSHDVSGIEVLLEKKNALEELIATGYQLSRLIERTIYHLRTELFHSETTGVANDCRKLATEMERLAPIVLSYDRSLQPISRQAVKITIDENYALLNQLFSLETNRDVYTRRFMLSPETRTELMIVFMEGIGDKKLIDMVVLGPIMLAVKHSQYCRSGQEFFESIANSIPGNQVKRTSSFRDVEQEIVSGNTALFIEGADRALLIETHGWEHRGVDKPTVEPTIRGNLSAFTETLRVNTGLIRAAMQTSDLITEIVEVGSRIQTRCAIMYLKSIANEELIAEVKKRLANIKIDHLTGSGMLELLICDHPNIPIPQTLSTERPDRVTPHLAEGRVAILLDGSPFILVVPFGFFGLYHSAEDFSLQFYVATFARLLRLVGTVLATVLPGIYLAISYYHQEALPTELALAIAGARERVPFPALVEVLLMELSFELIREAGTRIPGMLGSTIGIVGAIIIGQAAVAANIVSPIMVVIVAVTGLASFTIPDYRMSLGVRLTRFLFLFFAVFMGLVGISGGFLITTAIMCYMKSFGVPFLAPVAPKTTPGLDVVVRGPVNKQKKRPDELNTKVSVLQ